MTGDRAGRAEKASSGVPLLAVHAITAGYPGRPPVLRDASLRLAAGRRVALLGANGSGKTTLLRCLSGAHAPDAGQVLRDGVALRPRDRAGLREHRARVQLVLQDPDDQLFSADVRQDVSFGPMNLGLPVAEVRARVEEALELVGASHLADRPTHHLSYGERKRVATAGAVAMRPAVVLLDEPTAGLDPAGIESFLAAIDRLLGVGTTVALSTHDVALALGWADEVALIGHGVVRQGATLDILSDAAALEACSLRMPWPLDLALRAGLPGRPRDLDGVVELLRAQALGSPS